MHVFVPVAVVIVVGLSLAFWVWYSQTRRIAKESKLSVRKYMKLKSAQKNIVGMLCRKLQKRFESDSVLNKFRLQKFESIDKTSWHLYIYHAEIRSNVVHITCAITNEGSTLSTWTEGRYRILSTDPNNPRFDTLIGHTINEVRLWVNQRT